MISLKKSFLAPIRRLNFGGSLLQRSFSEEIFAAKLDLYNGLTVAKDHLPDTKEKFVVILKNSLRKWKEQKIRGVWLNIGVEKSEYISEAAKLGFVFHHSQPDYVMMTHWLSDEPNMLPQYTTHYVGVGGVVVNEKNEILLIQEQISLHEMNRWKIPGGSLDANEFIPEGAVREVWEETGVKAEFVSLIAFRETGKWRFGNNDIYFVALMRSLSSEITLDPQEIKDCKWMPIEEFVAQPGLVETQRKIALLASLKLNKIKIGADSEENLLDLLSLMPYPMQIQFGGAARDLIFYSSESSADKLLKNSQDSSK